ncbi:uncharacterized protein LOC143561329 [Bidens hawaiensis]|uniref:uncharacterized protein LOC143561329 n=1 Tax=Bidens hawaiensis TaxID=980011 RepID=UPI0040491961
MEDVYRFQGFKQGVPKILLPFTRNRSKSHAVAPFRFKCFLDAYKGYHQICMAAGDEDKTAFCTYQGTFCYKMMPFGLKNTGATYQRMMDEASKEQIGHNLEVYMEDLVIKSVEDDHMLRDIEETFNTLIKINMKLNPSKCSFGMEEDKFLGVLVTSVGFKANPYNVQAITRMPSPSSLKEVQALTGRKHTLSGLRKFSKRYRGQKVFNGVTYVVRTTSGRTINPVPFSADIAIGAILLTDRQTPRRYFQGHPINVLTGYKLKSVLCKPELSGRPAIKGQVLADFVIEVPQNKEEECLIEQQTPIPTEQGHVWSLFTYGASSGEGSGASLRLVNPEGHEFTYAIKLDFKSTNNEAGYKAFLAGLRIANKLGVQHLEARVDSMLIQGEINESYEAKNEVMASCLS